MKILMLTWNYPPTVGGIEQVAFHTASGLRARGHRVDVIAAALPPGVADPAPDIMRARRPGIPSFLLHALRSGLRRIRVDRPDIMLCPSLTSAPSAWLLHLVTRVPYAIQIHGSDILVPRALYQWAIRPLLRGACRLFTNSRNTADLLERRGYRTERIRVVCPGVTPPPPPSARPSEATMDLLARTAGRPTLVTVGRLIKRKGIREFIDEVLPLLAARFPGILYLVVGGEAKASLIHHERILDQLQEAIRRGGHEDRALILGRLSDADLEQVYRRADVFVLPCRDDPHDVEGFGIVILEAALHGVPSVATRCGGIPDAIADQHTGVLVPAGDAAAMADAIGDVLCDPARRRQLGDQARQRTLTEFTWDAIAARYEEALRLACAERR